jgi:Zn-dependent peptidase ImmA (M78 family)
MFAANFLMPEDGVRQLVGTLGKGSTSRLHAEVFDESGVVPVDTRTAGGSQDLQIYDVVKLAHHFGVNIISALYRLMNLRLITDKQFDQMKQMDSEDEQAIGRAFGSGGGIRRREHQCVLSPISCSSPRSVPTGEDQPPKVD